MKVIIAGGRDYTPTDADWDLLDDLDNDYGFTEVVEGEMSGADLFGREWAEAFKEPIPVKPFPADWDDLSEPCVLRYRKDGTPYNALSGPKRNQKMIEYVDPTKDGIILFPGDKGTADIRRRAIACGLKILYDGNEYV